METIAPEQLLETACRAADRAGKHALNSKGRRTETSERFRHDIKLVLDLECQQIAEEVISEAYPGHGILGEEESRPVLSSAYEWIIDPIDGTVNYAHGSRIWCCSVAVRCEEKVLAGCVYAPELDLRYTAVAGGPAQCNGAGIHPAAKPCLEEAVIHTGLSKRMKSEDACHFDLFRALALNTFKVRITGSAALDICQVAAGQADGFLETGIYLWDYAAAGLIAQQAGAAMLLYPSEKEPYGATVLCAAEQLFGDLNKIYTACMRPTEPA